MANIDIAILTVLRPTPVVGKIWVVRIVAKGPEAAARARKPYAAPLFRWASALALIGMAAAMITRRRAAWPVRRVSMRSRTTRQSPAYAPCDSFAVVSVLPPD